MIKTSLFLRQILKCSAVFGIALVTQLSHGHAQTASKRAPLQSQQIFAMPTVGAQLQLVMKALSIKRFKDAETGLNNIIKTFPWYAGGHYLLASLMSIQSRNDEAFKALETAIDKGFSNQSALYKDPNLAPIRKDKRFGKLAEKLITKLAETQSNNQAIVAPQPIVNGNAIISSKNTTWDQRFSVLKSYFKFNSRKVASSTVINRKDPAAKKLNELFQRGLAAGNTGDLYDNRDRRHSNLSKKEFPQLSFTQYGDLAKLKNTDYGLNTRIVFNAPTIGNSSTALNSGPFWRSQARLGYTSPGGPQKLFLQYLSNHLYIYPAVRDFIPKNGDLLPANSPYMIVTEGKSGSDRPFMKATASILAAFKPGVKDTLIKTNKLIPAVQMIFRKGQSGVHTKEAYLTSKAHPAVFSGKNINLIKMITLANNLEAEDVPPMVHLTVQKESGPREGIDSFAKDLPELLFNTPASIARIIRNTAFEKRLVVSTEKTRNPDSAPLSFKWVILQGDPDRIEIKKQDKVGSIAEIRIKWHDTFSSPGRPDITTNRVEIGVFADNGKELSAPSFINILYPKTQVRKYDASGKIRSIDHQNKKDQYSDPRLFPKRNWRDEYSYDAAGKLTGWSRTRKSKTTEFSRHGAIITQKDNLGRPLKAEQIGYLYTRDKKGRMAVTEKPLGKFLEYQYLTDKDTQGLLVP